MKLTLLILFGVLILGMAGTLIYSVWSGSWPAFKAFVTLFTIYGVIKVVEWEAKQ